MEVQMPKPTVRIVVEVEGSVSGVIQRTHTMRDGSSTTELFDSPVPVATLPDAVNPEAAERARSKSLPVQVFVDTSMLRSR
jgi:hypothetical protein